MSELTRRTLFGVVAAPLAVLIILGGGAALAALLAVVSAVAAWEFFRIARATGLTPLDDIGIALAGIVPLLVHARYLGIYEFPLSGVALLVLAMFALTIWMRGVSGKPLGAVSSTVFGVVYTGYDSRNGMYRLEQAHNDYLQVLSDGGIIGAVLGLFFVVNLFRMGFMRRDSRDGFRRGVATGAMAGCFGVLVHSFFDFTLHTPANALLFLVLAALATMNGRVEDVQSRRKGRSRSGSETPAPAN